MDASQFDQLTKTMAASTSRRRALGGITAGGLLGALGLGRTATAQPLTCILDFITTVRSGPTSGQLLTNDAEQPGEARGELSFGLSSTGALENGNLLLTDGTSLPVVGQATGNSLSLRIDAGEGLVLVAVGVGEQTIATCQGTIDGLMTGPQPGDLGDWHAIATGQGATTSTSVVANPAPAPPPASVSCPAGQTLCAGACVDLYSNLNHCGACGAVCESGLVAVECRYGVCERSGCQAGLTYCGAVDGCRNLATDPSHCGGCQQQCLGACQDGTCFAEQLTCEPGFTDCYGVCVDTSSDYNHCGGCDRPCGAEIELICVNSTCTPPDCGPNLTNCFGICTDTSSDSLNCGDCGTPCGEGFVCQGSTCLPDGLGCGPDQVDCGGICTSTETDFFNCGDCGWYCAEGEICEGAVCTAA